MTDGYGTFFETPEGLSTLRTMLRFAKAVGPFLAWFGIKPEQVEDMLRQSDDLLKIRAFNEIFLDRGWAAHRWLLFLANGETKPRTMGPGHWLVHSMWPLEAVALRIAAVNAGRSTQE